VILKRKLKTISGRRLLLGSVPLPRMKKLVVSLLATSALASDPSRPTSPHDTRRRSQARGQLSGEAPRRRARRPKPSGDHPLAGAPPPSPPSYASPGPNVVDGDPWAQYSQAPAEASLEQEQQQTGVEQEWPGSISDPSIPSWKGAEYNGQLPYESAPAFAAPLPPSLVESYRQTSLAKLWMGIFAGLSGLGMGSAISAYILHQPTPCMSVGALVGFAASYLGGNLGAFFRALAVTLMLTLSRWRSVTGQYAFMMQLKSILLNRRHRFPPNAPPNLRDYRPTPEHPLEFSMTTCLVASGLLGATLGWMSASAIDIFLFPPSLIALASALFFAFTATSETTVGDLVRCAAMKGVGVARLVTTAAAETEVRPKAFALAGQLGRRAQQIDRRFHVVDRTMSSVKWVIDRVAGGNENRAPPPRQGRRKGKRGRPRPPPENYYGEPPFSSEASAGYSGGYGGGGAYR